MTLNNSGSFNEIELALHMVFDRLSNGEPVEIQDEWIEEAGKHFTDALRRHLEEQREFRLRMSNIGRPVCQLQREKEGIKGHQPYNFFVQMMIGDAVEALVRFGLKAAQVELSGSNNHVEFEVAGQVIHGDNDVEIGGKVYDVKSCSSYAFDHKWSLGWTELYNTDTFGYVEQLYGYSNGQPARMGGWIVANKSSGEILVLEATPSQSELASIQRRIEHNVSTIVNNAPFKKCFEPVPEYYRKVRTGNTLVPTVCTFCPAMQTCWPQAVRKPKALSTAKVPAGVWYVDYEDVS